MPICPNCGYELVLLPKLKYKCALCSKLYPQKEIENKEFRRWNKLQKELDINNYEREFEEGWKNLKELKKGIIQLFEGIPNSLRDKESIKNWFKKYYKENKDKILARNEEWRLKNIVYDDKRKRKYYQKNKEKILLKSKIKRNNNLKLYNQKRKKWRNKNLEVNKIHYIIRSYRRKQKALALQHLKNGNYEASNNNIFHSVPTYPLSDLLSKKLSL